MFALMNPPLKKRRKAKPFGEGGNPWFGEPARHAAAARKGWSFRRKKHGKRLHKAKSLRTPGGGRIFAIAANRPHRKSRRNSFMGINAPKSSTHPSTGASFMAKRRRGGKRSRFNIGSVRGIAGKIKNSAVGVVPILGGVIANGLFTNWLSGKIPYTRKGIGNIVLGIADAGLMGLAASYIPGVRNIGNQVFLGGVVGTLGCAFQNLMTGGFKSAFGLGDDLDGLYDINPNPYTGYSFQGMGNFTTPGAVARAIPSESTMSQYALPGANAQFVAPPQTPMQAASAGHMADYEPSAVGAMLGQDMGMM